MIKERLFMPRISEYEKLILQLQSEEFEAAVNFKEACKTNNEVDPPITKIDIIQAIWEKMFPHNRLIRKSGFIELVSTGRDSNSYTAGRMSDSEKLVFYLIGAALCACPNALLVIEEPETLLHNSIKNQLWDELRRYVRTVRLFISHMTLISPPPAPTANGSGFVLTTRIIPYGITSCRE